MAPISIPLVDLLDHATLTGLDDIGPAVAVDVAVFPQIRRFLIDGAREFFDLNALRETVTDADVRACGASGIRTSLRPSVRVFACLWITSRSRSENLLARRSRVVVVAVDCPEYGSTVAISHVAGSTTTI